MTFGMMMAVQYTSFFSLYIIGITEHARDALIKNLQGAGLNYNHIVEKSLENCDIFELKVLR